jgi:hypothetical protein
VRIPSRIEASTWRCSATSESRASWTSTSPAGRELVLSDSTALDLIPSTNSCEPADVVLYPSSAVLGQMMELLMDAVQRGL